MKNIIKNSIFSILALSTILLLGCKKEELNTLSVSPDKVDFQKEGSSTSMAIQTDADSWSINNPASDWVVLSSTSGKQKMATVTLSVNTKTIKPRIDTLTITAGNAKPVQVIVSQPSSDYLYALSANYSSLSFTRAGNSTGISISTDATQWNISSDVDWLQFSPVTGNIGSSSINVTALQNTGTNSRTAIITITAEYAPAFQISVLQKGEYYPNYNSSPIAPDASGMSSTVTELAAKMTLGMNIGNTLEAIGGETNWGNPQITKAYIDLIKQSGFNAIRLPCSWNQYANTSTAEINSQWLDRVKQVIQYCVDDDMYVILNIHWDGGWLENNCTLASQEAVNAKQKAFWEQIATKMRVFDEHLMFASANEPNVSDATQMTVLLSYHQTFIDAVRSTGGKNSYRVLVIQGPSTDIDQTNKLMTTLPTDNVPNKMMVEIHYYTPWNFTGMTKDESWGNQFYYWGKDYHSTTDLAHNPTWGEESTVDTYLKLMKTQFVNKGIPVVMGEYGSMLRTNLVGDTLKLHKASRAFYFKYVTQQAKANGILPFFWDAGGDGAIFNRKNNTVLDQQSFDALIQGGTN